MSSLPYKIISDILLRLPVRSLCRFRCVSKTWCSLITHSHFVKEHLYRNTNTQCLILSCPCDLYSVNLESYKFGDDSVAELLKFSSDQNPGCCMNFGGSCDGLVLMSDCSFAYVLVNPSTKECRNISKSPFVLESECFRGDCGFGYDSSTDDYKVVSIYHYRDAIYHYRDASIASVYALSTNSWRMIGDSPYGYFGDHFLRLVVHSGPPCTYDNYSAGVFVSGALHWIARTFVGFVIAALDLANENFWNVQLPCFADDVAFGSTLSVLRGCLCVLIPHYINGQSCDDIWMMREYGVRDSWTKFTVTCGAVSLKSLCLSSTGDVLLELDNGGLVVFDTREGKTKGLVTPGCPSHFDVETYVESLVSPNYSNARKSQ